MGVRVKIQDATKGFCRVLFDKDGITIYSVGEPLSYHVMLENRKISDIMESELPTPTMRFLLTWEEVAAYHEVSIIRGGGNNCILNLRVVHARYRW
ncbi:MAG: hypothetical protein WCJ33_01790 [Pseudomonadota bacterium]